MVVRGGEHNFDGVIDEEWAANMASRGWRFSAHTHPIPEGVKPAAALRSSPGDQAILSMFENQRRAILNSEGGRSLFTSAGDSLEGWMP